MPSGHPMAVGQMGPIPMGYQLAKDPITGQILLIPTDPATPSGHSSMWPQFDGMPSLAAPSMIGGHNAPTSTASQHLHHLMIQQQHLQYIQQQDSLLHMQRQAASVSFQSSRNLNKVPETITVSDDEDELPSKNSVETKHESNHSEIVAPIVQKEEPKDLEVQIKAENVKEELKI